MRPFDDLFAECDRRGFCVELAADPARRDSRGYEVRPGRLTVLRVRDRKRRVVASSTVAGRPRLPLRIEAAACECLRLLGA